MSRTLHWDDTYCPNGHRWQFVASSTLYPDYYYCPTDDMMWEPTVQEISPQKVARNFNQDRPEAMKKYAKFLMWKESLSPKDMEKLVPHATRQQ